MARWTGNPFRVERPDWSAPCESSSRKTIPTGWPVKAASGPVPVVDELWRAYIETWKVLGNDPYVGRRLTSLLRDAGAELRRSDMLFFGGCAGEASFEAYVENFAGILEGARAAMVEVVRARMEAFGQAGWADKIKCYTLADMAVKYTR